MERGYIRLWRKIDDCKELQEPGKVYSKFEAWTDIVMNRARGTDNGDLKRGEFDASCRFLSRAWRWDLHKTHRFVTSLCAAGMLERVQRRAQRIPQRTAQRFRVCNYETYNPVRNANDNANDNAQRNKIKEGLKKEKETTAQAAGAAAVDPSPFVAEAERLSELLRSRIAVRDGNAKAAKLPIPPGWARDIEKILRIDGRRPEDVEKVIVWCQNDGCFWAPNVLSGRKLREKFDTMWGQMFRDHQGIKPDTVGLRDQEYQPTAEELERERAERRELYEYLHRKEPQRLSDDERTQLAAYLAEFGPLPEVCRKCEDTGRIALVTSRADGSLVSSGGWSMELEEYYQQTAKRSRFEMRVYRCSCQLGAHNANLPLIPT